jgi:hypothetical protein
MTKSKTLLKVVASTLELAILFASVPVQAQFASQARININAPLKVVIQLPSVGPRAGEPVNFSVQLQNGKNQPAVLAKDMRVEIQLLDSGGVVSRKVSCTVPANVADAKCTVPSPKAGLYKVRAIPENRELAEGSGFVLIRPAVAKKASAAPAVRFLAMAYSPQDSGAPVAGPPAAGGCAAETSRSVAKVILTINEGGETGGAFRASVESATIQAFFQADDGGSAPSDILVWLSSNHGELDREPLVIRKCSISGEAHLTSRYPVQASIRYTVVPSKYAVESPAALQASFVRPIIGVAVIPPDKIQTLSLTDREPVVARFFDIDGIPVPSDIERTVTFVSNNSFVGVEKQSVTLKPGDSIASTVLLPFWMGSGVISVTSDRLKPTNLQVQVVGAIVIAVCLTGGLFGGLVLFLASGGSIYSRLIVGVAAGIVLSWAYVFGLLPKVDSVVAHNYISVFVVSILGGYLGVKVFDLVLERFGWVRETQPAK